MKKAILVLIALVMFFLVLAVPCVQYVDASQFAFLEFTECSALLLLSLACYQLYKPSTK